MNGKHQLVEPDPAARTRKPAVPAHREAPRPIPEAKTIQAAALATLPGGMARARARHAANLQRQMGNAYVSRLLTQSSAADGRTTLVDRATGPLRSSQPADPADRQVTAMAESGQRGGPQRQTREIEHAGPTSISQPPVAQMSTPVVPQRAEPVRASGAGQGPHVPDSSDAAVQRASEGTAAALARARIPALYRAPGNPGQAAPPFQDRHADGADGHLTSVQRSAVHDVLASPGQPLAAPLKKEMEARLGADFSDVRLHTGPAAQRSAEQIGARAYTCRNRVVLGQGDEAGHILAHELTHVIQQRSGPVAGPQTSGGFRLSDPSDRFERDAQANASRVMTMRPPVSNLYSVVGNQVGQRLFRQVLSGSEPAGKDINNAGWEPKREDINNQDTLNVAIQSMIDEDLGGIQGLFMKGDRSSPSDWAKFCLSYMEKSYTWEEEIPKDSRAAAVLTAVKRVKDQHREQQLLHIAKVLVYDRDGDERPYNVNDLKTKMEKGGAYLEPEDNKVLEDIFETEGKFATKEVKIEAGSRKLLDEDNIVVAMDAHQNKHQNKQLPEFEPYTGGKGSTFNSKVKNLAWHQKNTAIQVKSMIEQAIQGGNVSDEEGKRTFSTSKRPVGEIIYDLVIKYDEATGKYVGVYHCNPKKDEPQTPSK